MTDQTSLEEAMGRVEQRAADMEALIAKRPDAWDDAVHIAADLRTLLTALRSRPTVEEVAEVIGWHFARLVSRNPQPSMSGDPRDHIQPWERQRFSRAEADAAQAVLSLFTNGTTDQTPMGEEG